MAKVLKNITVDFASLVDEPANPHARILLYKRAEDVEKYVREEGGEYCVYSKDGKKIACHKTRAEALAQLRAIEANKAIEKIGRKVSAARLGQMKQAMKALLAAMNGLESEDEDKEEGMGKRELLKANGDTPEEPTDAPPAPDPVPEEPAEPAPESVSKAAYVALEKKVAEFEALAKSERNHRLTTEAIQKARTEYPEIGDPTVIGPIMKRAADALSVEDVAEITRVFKAASEQLRQSALFGELGRSGATAEASATETLMKMAREAVTAGTAPDLGEALTRVTSDPANRRLVEQYRAESMRRN